jgi:uncharacterized membrane protein
MPPDRPRGGVMLAAEPYMIAFRILHILGGVIWVGSTFLLTVFIGPAAAEVGPSAGPLMHKLVVDRRVTQTITTIAIVTVAAGVFVYWHNVEIADSLGDFLDTSFGLVLTIGAVSGIAAAFWGSLQVGRKIDHLVEFTDRAIPADGPPPPDVVAELDRRGAELKRNGIVDLLLQLVAVLAMSTARYW